MVSVAESFALWLQFVVSVALWFAVAVVVPVALVSAAVWL